ncbi:hypothetical protein FA15DRAFT_676800 [Coprinopsis marcescibilis]|uniref:Transmembrane protein 135 N-terminal domain-containing protein n=1 Tax=Coprinopsis marcescibilis TaxID=230819 RepID=A0A5C3LCV1_COPMA|nr:hypothetical protein FA15DRAFT_676800 [Coprinopsis marcescibilis]
MSDTPIQRWWTIVSALEPTHPARTALRAYSLAFTLSLGPALVKTLSSSIRAKGRRVDVAPLVQLLAKELRHDGFAFAVATAAAGGPALSSLWNRFANSKQNFSIRQRFATLLALPDSLKKRLEGFDLPQEHQLVLFNAVAAAVGFNFLQAGGKRSLREKGRQPSYPSPTLDFTLLLVVRAMDSVVQSFIQKLSSPSITLSKTNGNGVNHAQNGTSRHTSKDSKASTVTKTLHKAGSHVATQVDAFVFWVCTSRIMWCFFYDPHRLPRSYVKWIATLAHLDSRLIRTLQLIKSNDWSYIAGSPKNLGLLQEYAVELGLPASWGNPELVPAYGGAAATAVWQQLGVKSRPGVGGIPCELVHGKLGAKLGCPTRSCHVNATLRIYQGLIQALAIYLPVHFIPTLLTRPSSLLQLGVISRLAAGALRSSAFLSSFIALYYYAVCCTRTLVLARLFPSISHQIWDGPYGGMFVGSLVCGSSIWIENGKRRSEMALYVLPRALRTLLPRKLSAKWLPLASLFEGGAFVVSMAVLLHAAAEQPDSLRGLSRWTLSFVTKGFDALGEKREPPEHKP